MNYFESINPTNGQIIKEYLALSEDELNEILLNTDKRFDSWKKNSVDERSTSVSYTHLTLPTNREV